MPNNTASIRVQILYFARLADSAQKDEEIREIRSDDSLENLYNQLHDEYNFNLSKEKVAVAINHNITKWHAPIHDGDVIAFIPPVAGG